MILGMNYMKFVRIFLLILIVIGLGLLVTQKIWVPKLVVMILNDSNAGQQMLTLYEPTRANDRLNIQTSSSTPQINYQNRQGFSSKEELTLPNQAVIRLEGNNLYIDNKLVYESIPNMVGNREISKGILYTETHHCDTYGYNFGDSLDCYSPIAVSSDGMIFGFVYWQLKIEKNKKFNVVNSTLVRFNKDGGLSSIWSLQDFGSVGKLEPLRPLGYIIFINNGSVIVDSSRGTEEGRSMNLRIYNKPGPPIESIDSAEGEISDNEKYIAFLGNPTSNEDFVGCGWNQFARGNWELINTLTFSRELMIPKSITAYYPFYWTQDNKGLVFVGINLDEEGCVGGYTVDGEYDFDLHRYKTIHGVNAKQIYDNQCAANPSNYFCSSI